MTCPIGALNAGASATVTITATVPSNTPNGQVISNTATAAVTGEGFGGDPVPGNNSSTTTTTVSNPSADLSITKTDSADPVSPNQSFNYTLVVTNLGPTAASSVSVSDNVPSQFTVSGTPTASAGSCSNVGNAVSCSLASLSPTGSNTWTITIPVTVNANTASGTYSNTGHRFEHDPRPERRGQQHRDRADDR